MKTLITFLFSIAMFAGNAAFAQKADSLQPQQDSAKGSKDSLKVPARKPDYFSKYKKQASANSNKPQVNDTWNAKKEDKKVESSYKYENGRVVGGETKLKLGKKN
jgi:Ni/Co efflux regulator RcnB